MVKSRYHIEKQKQPMKISKTIKYIGIILLFLIPLTYVVMNVSFEGTYEITPEEARKKMQTGDYDYIVDVRTDQEWTEDHLPNTIHIPIGNLVTELPNKIPDKNARILFVCKKGVRASGVVTIAHKLGYTNVQAMIGNFKELQKQ